MGEEEGLALEHEKMIAGSNIEPHVFADLRETYAENPAALRQIRKSELHDEYLRALESGDVPKREELLREAEEKFPGLYAWLSY